MSIPHKSALKKIMRLGILTVYRSLPRQRLLQRD